MTPDMLEQEGYVKLADAQTLPDQPNAMVFHTGDYAYDQAQKDMVEAGWRKVILEVKE